LMRKEEELQRLVSEVTDPERGKLAKKQQELTQPILAQVNEVVAKVAKDNGYDYVLNTAALVYANEDHDLTEKVLEELDKIYFHPVILRFENIGEAFGVVLFRYDTVVYLFLLWVMSQDLKKNIQRQMPCIKVLNQ